MTKKKDQAAEDKIILTLKVEDWGAASQREIKRGDVVIARACDVPVLPIAIYRVSGHKPETYDQIPAEDLERAKEIVPPGHKTTKLLIYRACIHCSKPFLVATSDLLFRVECSEHYGQLKKTKKVEKAGDEEVDQLKAELVAIKSPTTLVEDE